MSLKELGWLEKGCASSDVMLLWYWLRAERVKLLTCLPFWDASFCLRKGGGGVFKNRVGTDKTPHGIAS
jgi:hypothetical protein